MSQDPPGYDVPPLPKDGTTAAQAYFRAARSDFDLFHFIIDIVLKGRTLYFSGRATIAAVLAASYM